jgi:hypothetical protein
MFWAGATDLPLTTVLLNDLPPMLEDMISSLLQPLPDIRVVRGSAHERDLIAAAAEAGAQVVMVVRRDPMNLAEVDQRLAQAATFSIFALAPDGAWACSHKLRPEATRLEDFSIVAALTAATPQGRR